MKTLLLIAVALTLSACVSDRKLSNYVCSHQISVRDGIEVARRAADKIKDPVIRQAAIDAADRKLALVDACPPIDMSVVP